MDKILKNLLGNTLIFIIGNGSALLVSFFMIPVYTSVLSRTAFGISDLISTTVSMLLPVVSLNIYTAVFRWSLDENQNKSEIFTNGLYLTGATAIIAVLTGLIFLIFHKYYISAVSFNLSAVVLLNFYQNFFRGSNKILIYSASGMLTAVINAFLNVLLMLVFKFGLAGYLLSLVISNYFGVIFLAMVGKSWNYWSSNLISHKKIREMLQFSTPMIPNAFTWWLTNDVSRIIILMFIGPAGNGLYAIANKLPSMIFTIFGLFQNAWQISSVKTSQEKEVEKIYSVTFNSVVSLMIYVSAVIVCVIKIFMKLYVAHAYFEVWRLIPILLITAIFSNISVFLGTTYTVVKKTKGLFTTTVWGTIVNLILCCILIPIVGIQGAGISGSLGFLVVSLIRLKQTAQWIKIRIIWKNQLIQALGYFFVSLNIYLYPDPLLLNIFILIMMGMFWVIQQKNLGSKF